jgi:ATP-dependent RNA helicase DDX54/DBP10
MLFMTVRKEQKSAALAYLFKSIIPSEEKTIVFVATRHHVEYMRQLLDAAGIECTFVYGQLDAAARKINIAKFRNNLVPVLIVTVPFCTILIGFRYSA